MVALKGRTGGLSLILGAYSSKVECIEDLPIHDYGECSKVLGRMQVTNFPHLFSSWEIPRKKSVIVPLGGLNSQVSNRARLFLANAARTNS